MQELTGKPLHQSILGGVHIVCPAELSADIKDFFDSKGFDVGNVIAFPIRHRIDLTSSLKWPLRQES